MARKASRWKCTRWREGDERQAEVVPELPGTRLVCVDDRKSDLLAMPIKARALDHAADYLLSRSTQQRAA